MLKADIRRLFLTRQRMFSSKEVTFLSQQITDRFFASFPLETAQAIHCFLPIAKNNEVDMWLIISQLLAQFPQVSVVVPKANLSDYSMTHHQLTAKTILATNAWGIEEPVAEENVSPLQLDYVLIPLLAYDQQGYRVGYGKGFYDRFLTQCRPDVTKIGVSYFDPVPIIADTHPFDIRLDYCLTPQKLWTFEER